MKKRSIFCSVLVCIGLLLAGCSNSFDHMPDLTEEESAIIAEYAAGILIKHDKNAGRLASDAQIAEADERERIRQENLEKLAGETETEEEMDKEGEAVKPSQENIPAASFPGIAQFCGIEDFQIDYAGHMVCDFYPTQQSGDMVFTMDATEGSRLLVLQFVATNTAAEDKELNLLDKDVRFRISINDGEMVSTLSTLLLDDLSSYKGTIPAGGNMTLVLVREIPETEEVNKISLLLKSASGNATTLLE